MIESQAIANAAELPFEDKMEILSKALSIAGLYPELDASDDQSKIFFQIYNCPFKEVTNHQADAVCGMHNAFLKGMFSALFTQVELIEQDNMIAGCETCSYKAVVTK